VLVESVLIVFGILSAFAVSNWWVARQDRQLAGRRQSLRGPIGR
jgi:hypothetical protein